MKHQTQLFLVDVLGICLMIFGMFPAYQFGKWLDRIDQERLQAKLPQLCAEHAIEMEREHPKKSEAN